MPAKDEYEETESQQAHREKEEEERRLKIEE